MHFNLHFSMAIVTGLLFITSCSKETKEKGDCLLIEVSDEYSVFEKYYCDCEDKSKITKINWNKLGASKYEFVYENDIIIGANVEVAFSGVASPPFPAKENYTYNESGLLLETPQYSYEYNNNNQLIKEYAYSGDSLYEYTTFIMNSDGNIIEEKLYKASDSLIYTDQFEYDAKDNFFYQYNLPFKSAQYSSKNNVIKRTRYEKANYDGTVVDVQIIEDMVFEYNEMGYPVKRTRTSSYKNPIRGYSTHTDVFNYQYY